MLPSFPDNSSDKLQNYDKTPTIADIISTSYPAPQQISVNINDYYFFKEVTMKEKKKQISKKNNEKRK